MLSLPSHQHLRTLSTHSGPLTHLSTLIRTPDLGTPDVDKWPPIEVKPFERMRVGKTARYAQEVTMSLRPGPHDSLLDALRPIRERSIIVAQGGAGERTAQQLADVIAENKRLRTSLERAVKINDQMWKGVVDLQLVKIDRYE